MAIRTTEQGLKAEQAVAELLEQEGFEIIGRNWKTKVCEIDLVARRSSIIYFIEVKFRGSDFQGDGFEYIGPQKLHKMDFAATVWLQHHNWNGDYRLMAAAVSGPDCESIDLIEV